MSPGQIIQWVKFVLLCLQHGKKFVDLAIDVYERIEYAAKKKRENEGVTLSPKEKAGRFNRTYIAEAIEQFGVAPPPSRIKAVREGVWRTRAENLGREPKVIADPAYPGRAEQIRF